MPKFEFQIHHLLAPNKVADSDQPTIALELENQSLYSQIRQETSLASYSTGHQTFIRCVSPVS